MADVPYNDPQFGKAQPCPVCHDKTLSQRLAECSQLTGWLTMASLDGYKTHAHNTAAKQAALALCDTTAGWLTLWGGYGTGKTHLLAGIVNRCVKSQIPAVYYTLPDLLDRLRGSYDDDSFDPLLRRLANVRVLVVDEIDKARPTAWAAEKIYQLMDARYRGIASMATVFAMNRSPEQSGDDMDYILSRMHDRRCTVVEVGGGDVRPLEVGE
jgi:DNA replication protein DnaC